MSEGFLSKITERRQAKPKRRVHRESVMALEGQVHMRDDALEGFSYQDLVDTVRANEPDATPEAVFRVFNAAVNRRVAEARTRLKANMRAVLNEIGNPGA